MPTATPLKRTSVRPTLGIGSGDVAPEDLVSAAGIAAMLRVAVITAHRYSNRPDFPEPLGQVSTGRVWLRRDVEAWAKETLPLSAGRPPRKAE